MDARAERHRIVLTGVTGTLGRSVQDELTAQPGVKLLALLRDKSRLAKTHATVRYECVDFLDANSLAALVQDFQPTAFIHCAATGMQTPRPAWAELVRFNVDVSVQLCEIVSRVPKCEFIFITTGLAYGDQGRALREDDPLDTQHPYAATKAAAETLMRSTAAELGVPLTIFRPFSFSGAGDAGTRLFPSLLRAAAEKRPFDLSPGDQRRDHCAVADIARGVVLSLDKKSTPSAPRVFNLGSGSAATLKQLVEGVVAELGLDVRLNFGTRDHARFEPKYLVADIARARTQLQWQPQTNFAHAIWQLARESFPSLKIKEPRQQP